MTAHEGRTGTPKLIDTFKYHGDIARATLQNHEIQYGDYCCYVSGVPGKSDFHFSILVEEKTLLDCGFQSHKSMLCLCKLSDACDELVS